MHPTLTIKEIILETYNTKSFILEETDGKTLDYKAGQFISLIHPQDENIRRSYSFSSCPESEAPKITIKRIDNGVMSRFLFDQTKEGDQIQYSQIGGLFTITQNDLNDPNHQFVFFAAGSGITPSISMIKYLLPRLKPTQQIRLIYSNNTLKSTIFYDELTALEQEHEQLKIKWLFSDSFNLLRSRLNNFLLIDFLNEWTKHHSKNDFQFFICGPIDYMDTISITLLTEGFDNSQIRKEVFFNPDIASFQKPLPPDKEMHYATIILRDKEYKIEVPYPKSIMQAAHDYGIEIPFSCESGQCGSCVAQLKKGEVWMSYNEVLTSKDIENGLRLTCVGHPIHGDVEIEY